MLFGVGCTNNEGDEGGVDSSAAEITISKTEAGVSLEGGSVQVDVTSNANWVVSSDQPDVVITPNTGKNAGSVTITIPESPVRTVNVLFTATKKQTMAGIVVNSTAKATLTINQNATGEVVEGGIASIKEVGNYDVEGAWVIATYAAGFIMTDNSGGMILVFQGNNATNVPAVGQVVNVSGTTTMYSGFLQFGNTGLSVETTGETVTVVNPTPEVMDGAALDAWTKDPTMKYVEYEGLLSVSGNYYNVVVADATVAIGSVSYAGGAIKTTLDGLNGKYIKVTGWLIGFNSSKYVNTMATSVVGIEAPEGSGDDNTGATATGVFTSDEAFVCSTDNSGNKVYSLGASTINGGACSGFKLGTGSNAGFFTSAEVGVSGTKTIGFYGVGWKGSVANVYIKVEGSDVIKKVAVKANDGATGNPPFTITMTDADFYSVELEGLTETSKIMFSTDATFSTAGSTLPRAVLAGVTVMD